MKKIVLILGILPTILFAKGDDGVLSKAEKKFVSVYLKDIKKDLYTAINDLTEEQWYYKSNDSTWSVSETCQHLAIVEESFYTMITEKILNSEKNPDLSSVKLVSDEQLMSIVKSRNRKVKTGAQFDPNGKRMSKEDFKKKFSSLRNRSISFTKSTKKELKSYYQPAPFGTISAYQWLLVMATHTERHLKQIQELQGDEEFPI